MSVRVVGWVLGVTVLSLGGHASLFSAEDGVISANAVLARLF